MYIFFKINYLCICSLVYLSRCLLQLYRAWGHLWQHLSIPTRIHRQVPANHPEHVRTDQSHCNFPPREVRHFLNGQGHDLCVRYRSDRVVSPNCNCPLQGRPCNVSAVESERRATILRRPSRQRVRGEPDQFSSESNAQKPCQTTNNKCLIFQGRNLTNISIHPILFLESPIVEISDLDKLLLVSNYTKCILCNTESEEFKQVSTKKIHFNWFL